MADAIAKRQEELAELITEELGCTLFLSQVYQVVSPVMSLNYNAEIGRRLDTAQVRLSDLGPLAASSEGGSIIPMAGASLVVQEPVGVVAAFPAYNFAFPAVPQKVGPALIAGCTAVVKVTEPNPLATFIYGDICEEIGLPPGVHQHRRRPGSGGGVPRAPPRGRHGQLHRLGRRPEPASPPRAASSSSRASSSSAGSPRRSSSTTRSSRTRCPCSSAPASGTNAGQSCVALTRLVVPAAQYDEYAEALVEGFRSLKIGDPMEADTVISPLVTERQRDRVEEYVELARKEGATIATGGRRPAGPRPRLVLRADADHRRRQRHARQPRGDLRARGLADPHHGEEDAMRIANDSELGLSGAVFTADDAHGFEIARRMRTGTFSVNTFAADLGSPFGGYKKSGIGREHGPDGLPGVPALQDHLGRPQPSAPGVRHRRRTSRNRPGHGGLSTLRAGRVA